MLNRSLILQLTRSLARAKRVLIVSHANCGDATGSVLACRFILERLGKQVVTFLPAPPPKSFRFLPKAEEIMFGQAAVDFSAYDVWLCVDLAEPKLSGFEARFYERPPGVITVNVDHHQTNPEYGDVNIVDRSASATCAMLYEWFRAAGYPIDRKVATCLLTGILTDTGSFSNPGTNEAALESAAGLLLQGASVSGVLERVVRNKTVPELKLWGRAFERLYEHPSLKLVVTIITQADLNELGATDEALEGVANFLNDLAGYRAVLVLKEKDDSTIKGSLRTTRDDVDVAAIAKLFGGGGHRKAAGFSVPGRLVETELGWQVAPL